MMEQVRVGILGTSWWADAMYLPALKNHPKASIEAVAGEILKPPGPSPHVGKSEKL